MEQLQEAVAKARAQRGSRLVPERAGQNSYGPYVLTAAFEEGIVSPLLPSAFEEHKIVANQPVHPAADTYRALRAQVTQRLAKSRKTILGITSPSESAGSTMTAVNLAVSIAMDASRSALLIDLNLRDPSVHTVFGIRPRVGIADLLDGRATLQESLINPGLDRLRVLAACEAVSNSAELLASPQMTQFIRAAKQSFPEAVIICDLPSILVGGDTIGFLPNVEAILLVVREGNTRRADLQNAYDLIGEHEIIGTVLNAAA